MFMNGAEYSMLCSPRPSVPIPDFLGEEVDGCLAIATVTRPYKHDSKKGIVMGRNTCNEGG